jgi:hypothetical protein
MIKIIWYSVNTMWTPITKYQITKLNRNIMEVIFWPYYKIWEWLQDAFLWLIFDKINKPKKYIYVLRIRTGEAMYVQRKSVACSVIVLQLKQNNAFFVHCWATRYCKPCKNAKYSTTMPLRQIYVASNNK